MSVGYRRSPGLLGCRMCVCLALVCPILLSGINYLVIISSFLMCNMSMEGEIFAGKIPSVWKGKSTIVTPALRYVICNFEPTVETALG